MRKTKNGTRLFFFFFSWGGSIITRRRSEGRPRGATTAILPLFRFFTDGEGRGSRWRGHRLADEDAHPSIRGAADRAVKTVLDPAVETPGVERLKITEQLDHARFVDAPTGPFEGQEIQEPERKEGKEGRRVRGCSLPRGDKVVIFVAFFGRFRIYTE